MKDRFDRGILDTQARLHEERESVRRENKLLVDELNAKVWSFTHKTTVRVYYNLKIFNRAQNNENKFILNIFRSLDVVY